MFTFYLNQCKQPMIKYTTHSTQKYNFNNKNKYKDTN